MHTYILPHKMPIARTLTKRIVMWAYCHDFITANHVVNMFRRFDLGAV